MRIGWLGKSLSLLYKVFFLLFYRKKKRGRSAKLQSMDRYQRVEKPRAETPISENEIRVTTQGKMRNYITYATTLLQVLGLTGPLLPFCLFIVVVALFFLSKIFLCLTHFSPRLQVLPLCFLVENLHCTISRSNPFYLNSSLISHISSIYIPPANGVLTCTGSFCRV